MIYLYHRTPKDIRGNILYPLNELRERYPDIYEKEVNKYVGREFLMQQIIPTLRCLWNDVLHLSAVNPVEIKKALIEAGHKNIKSEYYQFNPKVFDPKNTTVFLYNRIYDKDRMNEKNFVSYNPEEIEKYSLIPQETKEYYKIMIDEGESPMSHYRIPHILYKGGLDITDLTKVYI